MAGAVSVVSVVLARGICHVPAVNLRRRCQLWQQLQSGQFPGAENHSDTGCGDMLPRRIIALLWPLYHSAPFVYGNCPGKSGTGNGTSAR